MGVLSQKIKKKKKKFENIKNRKKKVAACDARRYLYLLYHYLFLDYFTYNISFPPPFSYSFLDVVVFIVEILNAMQSLLRLAFPRTTADMRIFNNNNNNVLFSLQFFIF